MSLPASWAVQMALFERLSNDAGMSAASPNGVRVHDAVPDEPVYPFVTIGEARCEDFPGVPGAKTHEVRIHAYSRWGGRAEVKRLADAIEGALSGGLALDGHRLVSCRLVFTDVLRRPDQDSFHAALRFRLVTEPQETP